MVGETHVPVAVFEMGAYVSVSLTKYNGWLAVDSAQLKPK
jgi:hypothetical protein